MTTWFLLLQVFSSILSFPQFKVVKYYKKPNLSRKIFKRVGDEQCSYYEHKSDDGYYSFTLVEQEYMYFKHKQLTDAQSRKIQICPKVEKTSAIKYVYKESVEKAGEKYTHDIEDDHPKDLTVYDFDTCIIHENMEFTVKNGLENMDNPSDTDCFELVPQEVTSKIAYPFLLIANDVSKCQYGSIDSVTLGKR